ncbi:MAG: response regulator transcription factor [Planctomycetes bacterium]|nr:response regulator transcription factor [Planctomycetota bacterium]
MSIRVVAIDDHSVFREGLRLVLDQYEDIELVGEAGNGREGIEVVAREKPDVVIMDVNMPGLNGIEASRKLLSADSDVKILILSAYSNRRFVTELFRAGVRGYILKESAGEEVIRAIIAVAGGDSYICPKIANVIIKDYAEGGGIDLGKTAIDSLTIKERELLQLLAEGISTKEVAVLLSVSIKTVDARRRSIMTKLGISSMAKLTKFAIREGITSLEF